MSNIFHIKRLLLAVLVLLLALSSFTNVQAARIDNIRVWDAPDNTRLVLDTNAKVVYSSAQESSPHRFVVDIVGGESVAKAPDFTNNPRVSRFTHRALDGNTYRLVFELKNRFDVKIFQLTPNKIYGHRVVIDLHDYVDADADADAGVYGSATELDAGSSVLPDAKQQLANELEAEEISRNKEAKTLTASQPKAPAKPTIIAARKKRSDKLIVAIDAGHGGEDPGAVGWRRLREKDITLKISKRLLKLVNSNPNMQAHLVRTGDYFIKLSHRTQIARKKDADLFVSIHADAFDKPSANGLSVFALSQRGASSVMARALAKKENDADLIGGVSLKDKDDLLAHVLLDLSVTNNINESVEFGRQVLGKLKRVGRLHSKRVEQAGFAVLKSPDIPSILVETGFITNPKEAKKLNSSSYQQSIANAVYSGIKEYYATNPLFAGETTMLVEESTRTSFDTPVVADYSGFEDDFAEEETYEPEVQAAPVKTYHTVKSGDALSVIARRNGLKIREIKSWNKMKNSRIYIGQKLRLFDPSLVSDDSASNDSGSNKNRRSNQSSQRIKKYTVKRGDSLSVIAARHKLKQSALKKLNKLRSSRVYAGQVLKIPVSGETVRSTWRTKPKVSKRPKYHKVRSGDSWSSISARYNIKISALKKLNGTRSNTLVIGKKLLVSLSGSASNSEQSASALATRRQSATKRQSLSKSQNKASSKTIVYKVKSGDTLSQIAERYGKTMAEVRRKNNLKSNTVYIGQKLKI